MQNTRLSTLFDRLIGRFTQLLRNPWRRISVLLISLLGGNFFATIISTVAGQRATLDVVISILLVVYTEVVSWRVYREDRQRVGSETRLPLLLEILNGLKLGVTYGLFVEAFKLGS